MSRAERQAAAAKKIQIKAKGRAERKLPVANEAPEERELTEDELEEQDSAPSLTFDHIVKDSLGGE